MRRVTTRSMFDAMAGELLRENEALCAAFLAGPFCGYVRELGYDESMNLMRMAMFKALTRRPHGVALATAVRNYAMNEFRDARRAARAWLAEEPVAQRNARGEHLPFAGERDEPGGGVPEPAGVGDDAAAADARHDLEVLTRKARLPRTHRRVLALYGRGWGLEDIDYKLGLWPGHAAGLLKASIAKLQAAAGVAG